MENIRSSVWLPETGFTTKKHETKPSMTWHVRNTCLTRTSIMEFCCFHNENGNVVIATGELSSGIICGINLISMIWANQSGTICHTARETPKILEEKFQERVMFHVTCPLQTVEFCEVVLKKWPEKWYAPLEYYGNVEAVVLTKLFSNNDGTKQWRI